MFKTPPNPIHATLADLLADPHRANGMKADHVTERERMELIGATLSKRGAGSETERGETR